MNLRHRASLLVLLIGIPPALVNLTQLGSGPAKFDATLPQTALALAVPLLLAVLLHRWAEPADPPPCRPTPAVLAGCLALGFLLVLPTAVLSWISVQIAGLLGTGPMPDRILDAIAARDPNGISSARLLAMVGACTVGPLTEELLYRGVLFRELARDGHVLRSALLTSFFFAVLHVEPFYLLPLFAVALVFTATYRRYGVVASALVHGAFNLANLLLALFAQ